MSAIDSLRHAITQSVTGREKLDLLKQLVQLKPLLAPNGKPSKLNVMQHAQVRTPEFKAWFGDFEAVAKLQALENQKAFVIDDASLTNLTLEELRNEVAKRYNENKSNSEITTDGRNIKFTKIGLKEVRQHSADRKVLDLLSKAHEVLPNAIPLWSEEHSKKNAGDSIRTWHYYGAKVGLNNKDYFARFVVREDVNGSIYYDNDLTTVENISGHSVDATATKSRTADVSTDERSIKQWVNSINGNSSKIVDENGEPLVVYHGTDADIEKFATEKAGENGIASGLGSFFTDNSTYASEYAEKLGGNVIPVICGLFFFKNSRCVCVSFSAGETVKPSHQVGE